jgi:hypothetical protein
VTRLLLVSVVVVLAGPLAVKPAGSDLGVPERTTQRVLYGLTWQGSLVLVRVDRDTLRPLAGRRVPLAGEPLGWSFAPDRSRIVLGSTGRGARLRLIDLRAMRSLGDVRVTRRGSGVATAWAGSRRVLAVVVTPGCCGAGDTIVAGVDAGRRRVVWRRELGGSLQAGDRFRRSLLLVLGPRGQLVGPSRLVQVGARGRIRSAPLPQIRSGSAPGSFVTRKWNRGLAIDRSGGRAFVVQAQAPVGEVDLSTFEVRSHPLRRGARAADAVAGPERHAVWVGRALLAVTGSDSYDSTDGQHGGVRGRTTPAGLTLVDARRWRARTIDAHTTDAALVSGTLLASSFLDRRGSGSGLTGYSLNGRRKYHLFGSDPIFVQPIGRNALVGGLRGSTLIEARTGQQLRHYRRFAMSLLAGDSPFHY